MKKIARTNSSIRKSTLLASQVLLQYELWLGKHYGKTGNYRTNAKTFLKSCTEGADLIVQLDDYVLDMSLTMQSILRRFKSFLEEKEIHFVVNDLLEKKLPIGNIYVKLFLASRKDRLRGDKSLNTYATVLNQFFESIDNDLNLFNKRWAEKFINSPALSDFTKRLYKSILKAFCEWALLYQNTDPKHLSKEQLLVRKGLGLISQQSLREIAGIKVQSSRAQSKRYHKESLSVRQRDRLLKLCDSPLERAVISLMAWNGFRTIEVLRLSVPDCHFKERKIHVWGKGRSSRAKDIIRLFDVPRVELKKYMKDSLATRGRLFPTLTQRDIAAMVEDKFQRLGIDRSRGKYSPHSLRHTAGQIMYDRGIPLEFIQKTFRHSSLETTMVYAQKAIDRKYFKMMPGNV